MEALELFGREVLPEFAEREGDAREGQARAPGTGDRGRPGPAGARRAAPEGYVVGAAMQI